MNKAQLISILVIPMVNGGISFLASTTIIICIFRSNLKLSTTYRRLIFGLSLFDIFQSLSQGLSSVPMPKGSPIYFAAGNDITCDIQAFLAIIGGTGAIWYSLSLAIYFLMVIKYNLSDRVIAKRYEPFLHAFPILYALGFSIYSYATQNLNPSGPTCWIAYDPLGCENDPSVECINKGPISPDALKWITAGIPFSLVLILNCILLGMIWWAVRGQLKKSQMYRYSWIGSSSHDQTQNQVGHQKNQQQDGSICSKLTSCCSLCTNSNYENREPPSTASMSPLAARLSRPSLATIRRLQGISNRAIAYIIGYLLTYIFTLVFRIIDLWTTAPFVIMFLSRFFFPLQGFFNVIIYTYPHVMSCRMRNEQFSWLRAFWEVIKSGGDSDEMMGRTSRRDSLKKQQKLLAQRQERLSNMTPNSKKFKKNDSGGLVKSKQQEVEKYLSHKVDMSTTRLDATLHSSPMGAPEVDVEIGSNQSSPLHIDLKLNLSHQSDAYPESNGGSSRKESRVDDCEGGSSNSCNPRKAHKEKQEEEEKREIGVDEP